jgi:hypothetical protein
LTSRVFASAYLSLHKIIFHHLEYNKNYIQTFNSNYSYAFKGIFFNRDKRKIRSDAAEEWIWLEMELSAIMRKNDLSYLPNAELHLHENPPFSAPFVFSGLIGVFGYPGLACVAET